MPRSSHHDRYTLLPATRRHATLRRHALWAGVLVAGCIQDVGQGPALGTCADTPDGVYTYGQAGIGTCLASPVALSTLERDGATWLAISNADLYRTFRSGSLSLIPLDSLDFDQDLHEMGDLPVSSVELGHFLGQIGITQDGRTALVPGRASDDSFTQLPNDPVWVVDLSDLSAPAQGSPRRFVDARQDPFPIVMDDQDRAFVVNTLAHSVSIFQTDPVAPVDLAGESDVVFQGGDDADGSGTTLSLTGAVLEDAIIARNDAWTLSWVDGTTRLWVPTADGLQRLVSGAGGGGITPADQVWVQGKLGPDLSTGVLGLDTTPAEAWFGTFDNALVAFVADEGDIEFVGVNSASDFAGPSERALGASSVTWADALGGPAIATLHARTTLLFDGTSADGSTAIGVATSLDGLTYTTTDLPAIEGEAGTQVLQPTALDDTFTDDARAWMTVLDTDGRWRIGLSERLDGDDTQWTTPIVVAASADGDLAAPQVAFVNGAYRMFASEQRGGTWQVVRLTSPDGVAWSAPEVVQDLPDAEALTPAPGVRPPRVALQALTVGSWEVRGEDEGLLPQLAVSSAGYALVNQGWEIRPAHGHHLPDTLIEDSDGGMQPGSAYRVGDVSLLAATTFDEDDRPTVSILRQTDDGSEFTVVAATVFQANQATNPRGAQDPVVFQTDDGWQMLYAAVGTDDVPQIRRATSDDGRLWVADTEQAAGTDLLGDTESWDGNGRLPGHVQTLDNGNFRLWYSGFDGSVWRIGAADSTNGRDWAVVPGPSDLWWLGPGEPGAADDAGVKDPALVQTEDGERLIYAGFDGTQWSLGVATRSVLGDWTTELDPETEDPGNAVPALTGSFGAVGLTHPTPLPAPLALASLGLTDTSTDTLPGLLFAGDDDRRFRVGLALRRENHIFPVLSVPTEGDTLRFDTVRGDAGRSEIDLSQTVDGFTTAGNGGSLDPSDDGPTDVVYDEAAGMMYVSSRNLPYVLVVDVRDDSTASFDDRNVFDLEAVLRIDTVEDIAGVRAMALHRPSNGAPPRLYAATVEPDGLLVLDLSAVTDDASKDLLDGAATGSLPVRDRVDDAGEGSFSAISGSDLHLVPGTDLLLMTHFRDNSLSVFDLSLGAYGMEVAYLPRIGENPVAVTSAPHPVTGAPLAFIANATGALVDGVPEPSITVVDLDPLSAEYLTVRTRLVNQ